MQILGKVQCNVLRDYICPEVQLFMQMVIARKIKCYIRNGELVTKMRNSEI